MRALVTGATGLVGRHLVRAVDAPVIVSRRPDVARERLGAVDVHAWSPEEQPAPAAALAGVDVVFNLAGEPIAEGRWTAEKRRRIRDSRTVGTRNLVAALAGVPHRPRVLVSCSAVGYYGDRGDEELDEASPAGTGFLAELCRDWEREAMAAEALGVRVVCVRVGVVLAPGGGALARMLAPFRLGLGGRIGSGRQWMSWIHVDDLVGLLRVAAGDDGLRGPLNAVAPGAVTNAEFTRALARAVGRPALLPVPAVALRVALGDMSEVLLASQRVLPGVAGRRGFVFRHPALAGALDAVLAARTRGAPWGH
jgi:hypothetical protein